MHGEARLDADGLVVRALPKNALLVVPAMDYCEESLRCVRSCLFVRAIGTQVVSTAGTGLLRGRLQGCFAGDGDLATASIDSFDALLFCGGEGASNLALNPDALRLARDARRQNKPIGAWGRALSILAHADVLRGVRVTGDDAAREAVVRAGGTFTGRQLELHLGLCTGRDEAVGMRLGLAMAELMHGPQPKC